MSKYYIMTSELFRKRVYYAARDGMAITLYSLLSDKRSNEVNELLDNFVVEDEGQRCTPLIIAARHGHEKVVKMLLSKFNPDLEQKGIVKFNGYVIEGATALWCAAGAGHLNVVKVLVKAGANVNHPTVAKSTPLRAACFDGRFDIVKYLIDHDADIHIANIYNNTCLMIAAYKGHLDVVTFLLERGANPNEKAHCGATALYFAAESGHLEIVKKLLSYGAKFIENDVGMTALKAAAERTRADIVDYLVDLPEISKEEKIDALELLGASYANDKDNYCLELAYLYLRRTMLLRYSDPNNIIRKTFTKPVPAYENWIECQTVQELQAISRNPNSMHMEALTIRERILGRHNPEVPHPVIFRGAVFADDARFDRCIELWLHALDLRQLNFVSVVKDLLRFSQVFSQMFHIGIDLNHNHVILVLQAAVLELGRNKDKIDHPGPKDDPKAIMDEMEGNLTTTLYLITILTRLFTKCSEAEIFEIRRLIFSLNKLNISLRDGQTLLHLACNSETPVDDFHTNDVCKFPCAETTKLLIQCGADVNAMDNERNTPLHVIVHYHKPISDFATLHAVIVNLTEAGAHIDSVNMQGETPLDSASTGVAEIILKAQVKLSLKCIAAKAVNAFNLTYQGQVPHALESFIELHGPGSINQG